jgi:hypothetical protein
LRQFELARHNPEAVQSQLLNRMGFTIAKLRPSLRAKPNGEAIAGELEAAYAKAVGAAKTGEGVAEAEAALKQAVSKAESVLAPNAEKVVLSFGPPGPNNPGVRVLTQEEFTTLQKAAENQGVTLYHTGSPTDNVHRVLESGKVQIGLRNNATLYSFLHEYGHQMRLFRESRIEVLKM